MAIIKNIQTINMIHEKFVGIVRLYEKLEKSPRRYGTQELFTSPEIHLIETIGDQAESLSVTDLAKALDITKGAVSQRLKKLKDKGITIKEEDPHNISRSIVKLTSKGQVAYFSHKHWHETVDGGYMKYHTTLADDKITFLLDYLVRVEEFLKRALTD